jgi:hypothetical protein
VQQQQDTEQAQALQASSFATDFYAGDLTWANPLTVVEREDMKRELSTAHVAAMATGDWSTYDDALSAWRLTAEVAGDPELEADLLADDDAEDVPLRRP